ncbi:MAG: STAS domain-containing protein [Motilibacteraceae bacterium]
MGPVDQLVLSGRLDVHSVADVRAELHAAIDDGVGPLVVDLAGVEVADVTGLGVLVGAHRRAGRAGRTLVLRRVPPRLARLLTATRLHRILAVETYLAAHETDTAPALA